MCARAVYYAEHERLERNLCNQEMCVDLINLHNNCMHIPLDAAYMSRSLCLICVVCIQFCGYLVKCVLVLCASKTVQDTKGAFASRNRSFLVNLFNVNMCTSLDVA